MSNELQFESAEDLTAAREAVFSVSLDKIFDHHPHYRRVFEEKGIQRGDIRSLEDLVRLPITSKTDFVANPSGFSLALPADAPSEERVVWDVMYTTGSTGDPTPVISTSYDFVNILALNRNMLQLRGVTADDKILNLFPLTKHPHGAFARVMNAAAAYNIPVVAAMPGAPSPRQPELGNRMDDVCALAERSGATILWGVPSYMRKVLVRTEELGLRLENVRLVFVTGEGFGEEARRDLVDRLKRLGAPDPKISVSYGATEMQGGMVECQPGAGYHNPAPLQFYFEAVDPETHEPVVDGEEGLLLLTHLDRRGTTLLRYALGDTAQLTRKRCPHCGVLTERLISVPVRRDGFLKIRGMLVNPQALVDVLASNEHITDYQAIVDKEDEADALSMDRLSIRVLARDDAPSDFTAQLASKVKNTIGVQPLVTTVSLDDPAFANRGWKAQPIQDLRQKVK